jgi:hypothetical protein
MLPPTQYLGRLVHAMSAEVGANYTPAIILTFELTHRPDNGQWSGLPTGEEHDFTIYLSDKAKEFAIADLRKLGFNGDMDNPKFADSLYSNCPLDLTHELYNGKTYERIRPALLTQKTERKPMSSDARRAFAAQFKTAAGVAARPTAPPPPPPARAAPSAPAPATPPPLTTPNDDPPF